MKGCADPETRSFLRHYLLLTTTNQPQAGWYLAPFAFSGAIQV